MDEKVAVSLQALRDAQQNAVLAWQQFLSDVSFQKLGYINPVPMVTMLQAYRAQAQALAYQFPDNPFAKACVEQADALLEQIGKAQ
jgi:hypothetical protein